MKIRFFTFIVALMFATGVFAQAQRDTIFIYDTIRISVQRPTPPSANFFEQPTATISNDSIIIDEQSKQLSTMSNLRNSANRFIRSIAIGTMAAVSSISSVAQTDTNFGLAQSQPYIDTVVRQIVEVDSVLIPKKESPIYLSFAFPIGIHGVNSENYVYNLAFSALTGAVGGINGVQVGGIYNQVSGNVRGVQVGGIMNVTESVEGIQIGGICNFTKDVKGIQVAGIFNHSGDVKGIQVAGIANAANKFEGIQVAGIYNVADTVIGIQVAGISNEAEAVEGMQFAAIFNRAERVRGIQLGLYNRTNALHGVQIGFVNKVDTIEKGVSLGLFNILKHDRFRELEIIQTMPYHTTFLGYRMGSSRFHALMAVGTDIDLAFVRQKTFNMDLRFGFGNMTNLWDNLHLQTSLYRTLSMFSDASIFDNRARFGTDSWTTLSSGLVFYWGDKIGIKVVPSWHIWRYRARTHYGDGWSSWIRSGRFGSDVGIDIGLSIKL
jgi:hypothetical protein